MSHVEVNAGICGFITQIEAKLLDDGQTVDVRVESGCPDVQKLGEQVAQVNAFQEISFRKSGPQVLQAAPSCLKHPACPVPAAIIKAIEVAAGLALPKDVSMKITR